MERELLERTRSVLKEVVAPQAEAIDREARWPEAGLRALQAAGLGGLVVPRQFGGHGQGLEGLVSVCELLGTECASTAMCFGMHHVAAAVIAAKATRAQADAFLEPISRGQHLCALALSESGTGVHFYFPQTRLSRSPDGAYELHGVKTFVTNGGQADSYVVSAASDDAGGQPGQFACAIVTKSATGISWGAHWDGMGMRGNASRSMTLDRVPVPQEQILGSVGDQIWYVFHVVAPYFLVAMTGTYIGVAARALDEARRHLQHRTHAHSGRSLAQQPLLQHKLGELWAKVERTRCFAHSAATAYDHGRPDALPAVLSCKAEAAETAVEVVNEASTLCGGIAYREHGVLDRLLRDARAAHVMAPTTQLLRLWTGRMLLDQPLLGD